jgi:hypothetical protein
MGMAYVILMSPLLLVRGKGVESSTNEDDILLGARLTQVGFEPTVFINTIVFKTNALNHSTSGRLRPDVRSNDLGFVILEESIS